MWGFSAAPVRPNLALGPNQLEEHPVPQHAIVPRVPVETPQSGSAHQDIKPGRAGASLGIWEWIRDGAVPALIHTLTQGNTGRVLFHHIWVVDPSARLGDPT